MVKVVDEFFDPYRIGVGHIPVEQESSGHRVRRGIYVYGKGGEVVVLGVDERVDAVMLEERQIVGGVVDSRAAAYRIEAFFIDSLALNDFLDLGHLFLHNHRCSGWGRRWRRRRS